MKIQKFKNKQYFLFKNKLNNILNINIDFSDISINGAYEIQHKVKIRFFRRTKVSTFF